MSYINQKRHNALYRLINAEKDSQRFEDALDYLRMTYKSFDNPTEEEAADDVAQMMNRIGFDHAKFIEGLNRQHRTFQQIFSSICFMWIKNLAHRALTRQYDGRNEASCLLAEKIMKFCDENDIYVGRMPFI